MTLTDEIRRAIASLPRDARGMETEHWRIFREINQGLSEGARAEAPIITHGETTVTEDSTDAEKSRFRGALERAAEQARAFLAYDAWFRAAGMARLKPEINESHMKARQANELFRKRLDEIGDPTSPG